MRKFVLTMVAALAMFFCNAQKGYKIDGTVAGVPEGEAYFILIEKGKADTLGRTEIKGGKFEFTGTVEEPTVYVVSVKGCPNGFRVFLENKVTTIMQIDVVQYNNTKIQGGEQQAILNKYQETIAPYTQKMMEISPRLMQSKNREELSKVQAEMDEARKAEQEAMHKFIKEHGDSAAAAYIATEGIGNYLQSYVQKRYDLLSDKGKATKYGKLIAAELAKRAEKANNIK
ncbi:MULTISPECIES: DUF4369 domain-containing protein [Butyricimonas]|uniref:DUF4369 domain-containing protein n=1 Tax=Butyricimonas TaxID=574697 RepID=UPI0007FB1D57|nr:MULTISPECIES: DUF4369 domain-containing protein [Butyricimonas]